VRVLKITTALTLAIVLAATTAFAGGSHCSSQASATCSAKQTAACTAGQMANTKVEATRLSSGDLVVHYIGSTPEAVAYLQAKAAGAPDKFCCPMTQRMASNESCKVDISKVSNGVIVFVTSPKKEVVDAYEKEFATLTVPATTATK
jgi:hypothetical protein